MSTAYPNPFPGMNPFLQDHWGEPLALQPLVDRVYRTGRYWLTEGAHPLHPPAADEVEAAWIAERRQRTSGGH